MTYKDKLAYKFLGAQLTYSQCGEDIILAHIFSTLGQKTLSYLDIGTNDPKKCNNTFKFYEQGSKGVCVEPNPDICSLIQKERPLDVCLNIGVAVKEESQQPFYILTPHTLSTFSKEDAEAHEKDNHYKIKEVINIPVSNINSIIKNHFTKTPDLISIDVEGLNEEIVLSFDFKQFRPKVFCIETITYSSNNTGKKLSAIIRYLEENDYTLYADTHINSIFINNKTTHI